MAVPSHLVEEITCDPEHGYVYEPGWQSWSPAGRYRLQDSSPRPGGPRSAQMSFRPERPPGGDGFQGEGLLALELTDQRQTIVWSAPAPDREVPTITLRRRGPKVAVAADGAVRRQTFPDAIPAALEAHFGQLGAQFGVALPEPRIPAAWCSWGYHRRAVSAAAVIAEMAAMDRLDLPIKVVQVDDGWEGEVGDWGSTRPGFGSLPALVQRILASGRRAGVWIAPFLVGGRSRVAERHPEWMVDGLRHPDCWGQRIAVLDVTRADAAEHLRRTVASLVGMGVSYLKLDFLYAGAMEGRRRRPASGVSAYREGLRLIRQAAGPTTLLVGCGAPLLPSVGLVDAMRVGPDIALHRAPRGGDLSQPSLDGALHSGRSRAPMNGRLWVNDPDMLLARRAMPERDAWADHIQMTAGLRASGDHLPGLDRHGLELTRRILECPWAPPPAWDPGAGPLQGRLIAPHAAAARRRRST